MTRREAFEIITGGVVLAAAVLFLVYVGNLSGGQAGSDGYALSAKFGRSGGLQAGDEVRLAGVRIGAVRSVNVDYQDYRAAVGLEIERDASIPEDSIAEIRMDGLFGGAYLSVVPGAADEVLGDGDEFLATRSAVDLVDLIGRTISRSE